MTKEYPELIASKKVLLKVMAYLNEELTDLNYCDTVNNSLPWPSRGVLKGSVNDAWFAGQRWTLEDAIKHIDSMMNDIDNDLEAL